MWDMLVSWRVCIYLTLRRVLFVSSKAMALSLQKVCTLESLKDVDTLLRLFGNFPLVI